MCKYLYFPHANTHTHTFSLSVVFLFIAHIIYVLQISSYVRTIYAKHKKVPQEFHLTDAQLASMDESVDCRELLREIASDLPVQTASRNGSIRYCDKCDIIKPDRCHHCSVCGTCILKMDHHCPWVNNCVGYSNYKYFVLFLFYTVVLALWVCATGLYDFIRAWNDILHSTPAYKFQVIFCYFISAMFGFTTSFLLCFHVYLVCWNRTTLENMQYPVYEGSPYRRLYHLGVKRNLQQVFGKTLLRALLPVSTNEGDGVSFPLHISCTRLAMHNNHHSNHRGTEEAMLEAGQTSDSEVELFTSDHRLETQPLTKNTQL
jgi:hypothetical protein